MKNTEYTALILGQIGVVLRAAGFDRRAKSFVAERDDALMLVHLQGCERSTGESAVVTVNLGICSRALQRRGERGLASIAGLSCHWWTRIGHLTPHATDRWWRIADPVAAVEAAAEIAALVKIYCLPEMERLSSTERLRAHWRGGGAGGVNDAMRDRFLAALETE